MQDIINHGVEKSLREMPVYHGKTSSKYYSEVLGLEYDDSSSNSSSSHGANEAQPLDLSPVKKKDESVHLIKIRPLEANSLSIQPALPRSPGTLEQSLTAGQSFSASASPGAEAFPAWKKQKTDSDPPPSSSSSGHRTLPPISILQKPPVLSLISRKPDGSSYKHSSWIRDSGSSAPTDLSTSKKPGTPNSELLNLSRFQGQNGRTV
jgi:hypothetical protein